MLPLSTNTILPLSCYQRRVLPLSNHTTLPPACCQHLLNRLKETTLKRKTHVLIGKLWMLATGARRETGDACFDGHISPNVLAVYQRLLQLGLGPEEIDEFKLYVFTHRQQHPRMRYRTTGPNNRYIIYIYI